MASMTSIRTSGDKIEIVNQLLLPHTTEYIEIDTIDQAHDAIKTMKVHLFAPQTFHSTEPNAITLDPRGTCYRLLSFTLLFSVPFSRTTGFSCAGLSQVARCSQGTCYPHFEFFVHCAAYGRQSGSRDKAFDPYT